MLGGTCLFIGNRSQLRRIRRFTETSTGHAVDVGGEDQAVDVELHIKPTVAASICNSNSIDRNRIEAWQQVTYMLRGCRVHSTAQLRCDQLSGKNRAYSVTHVPCLAQKTCLWTGKATRMRLAEH